MPEAPQISITASPLAGQNIRHDGKEYTTIKEGLAHILVPHGIPTSTDPRMSKEDTQKQQVFYNPIQQFNRDLSVLAIKTFGEDTVFRKTERYEQNQKKAEKKRKRIMKAGADGIESSSAKKRKLETSASVQEEMDQQDADGGTGTTDADRAVAGAPKAECSAVTSNHKPTFTILDALSATGLRALRYAKEIPFATSITANDMSEKATQSIALNVKHNKLEDKITAHTGNAISYMYSFCDKKGYDVIDLDPYGTASPFIDSAIQAINDEGLLCVTCTDSAIFASHGYLEKTYSSYGGLPFIGDACHEGGLRLILHTIASSAARYGMAIEPLLSLSIDYYIRVFVKVRKSPNDVKLLAGKTMVVYHCDAGCGASKPQFLARNREQKTKNGGTFIKHSFAHGPSANEVCEHCGYKTHLAGPMYGGPLHNPEFVKRLLAQLKSADKETYPTMDRMEGMLHTALEEITFGVKDEASKRNKPEDLHPLIPKMDPTQIDHHPFFFIPSSISRVVHCSAPPTAALRGALRHAGFKVTMSHCKPGSIKTDASWQDIWHIMLEWIRQKAPLKNALKPNSAGHAIVTKGTSHYFQSREANGTAFDSKHTEQAESNQEGEVQDGDAHLARPSYLKSAFDVKFDEKLGRDADRGKYVRYQIAPRENWGPMSRAK